MLINLGIFKSSTTSVMTNTQVNFPIHSGDMVFLSAALPNEGDFGFLTLSSQAGTEVVKVKRQNGLIILERGVEGVAIQHPKGTCVKHVLTVSEVQEIQCGDTEPFACDFRVTLAPDAEWATQLEVGQSYEIRVRHVVGAAIKYSEYRVSSPNVFVFLGDVDVSVTLNANTLIFKNLSASTATLTLVIRPIFASVA